ncbi:MAG TPA: hypothetical protein VFZ23_02015 [Pyrinomonadaceae bacterium]
MTSVTESEFGQIVTGILEDRDVIVRHNPIGSEPEILLWMLMSCLVVYLSLPDSETPCFPGKPDAETYQEAIRFILRDKKHPDFDVEPYLDKLTRQ